MASSRKRISAVWGPLSVCVASDLGGAGTDFAAGVGELEPVVAGVVNWTISATDCPSSGAVSCWDRALGTGAWSTFLTGKSGGSAVVLVAAVSVWLSFDLGADAAAATLGGVSWTVATKAWMESTSGPFGVLVAGVGEAVVADFSVSPCGTTAATSGVCFELGGLGPLVTNGGFRLTAVGLLAGVVVPTSGVRSAGETQCPMQPADVIVATTNAKGIQGLVLNAIME